MQWLAKRAFKKRYKRIFAAAEGSNLQRSFIAIAMLAIEDDLVQEQRTNLAVNDQMIFMMTYECLVMWALRRGMATVLKREEFGSTLDAMHLHFARHAWYRPDAFEKIWNRMEVLMPLAMKPDDSGIIYPVAEMIEAANQAGYPLNPMIGARLKFGMHVGLEIGRLGDFARSAVEELRRLNQI
jgi:hypothetical protein